MLTAIVSKLIKLLLIGLVSASAAFWIHVLAVEKIRPWIERQMAGHQNVTPSWNVVIPAALTSAEYGVALTLLYLLLKPQLSHFNAAVRIMILAAFALALQGQLLRQGVMDYLIGNPAYIVLAQEGPTWVAWVTASAICVLLSDWVGRVRDKRDLD